MERKRVRSDGRRRLALVAAIGWAGPTVTARADNTARSWAAAGSGTWSTAANWSPAGVPGSGDSVEIAAPATGTRTVTYDYAGPAVTLNTLLLDGPLTGTFPPALAETLAIPAGTLTVTTGEIGKAIRGTVAQSGGTVTFGPAGATTGDVLNLGYSDSYGLGTYQLSGGSLTVNGVELVGEDSAGAFNQSGGTHTVTGQIAVGTSPFADTYTQTGGLTKAAGIAVGASYPTGGPAATFAVGGSAVLNTSGGLTVYPSQTAGMGNAVVVGGTATLNLGGLTVRPPSAPGSGSTLVVGGSAAVTVGGLSLAPGSLNWSGGSIAVDGQSISVDAAASNGTLGPTLTIGPGQSLRIAQQPGVGPSVGPLTETVGQSAAGVVTQTGGSNTADLLTLAAATGGSGVYNLSGGTLSAGTQTIAAAGPATVNQTGGQNTATTLTLGNTTAAVAAGVYNLSGGTLSAGTQTVAVTGPATINQTGGRNTATTLTIGNTPSAAVGTYNLSGGTLSASSQVTVNATGTFALTAGGTLAAPAFFVSAGRATFGGVQQWPADAVCRITAGTAAFTTDAGAAATYAPTLTLEADGGSTTLSGVQHLASVAVAQGARVAMTGSSPLLVASGLSIITDDNGYPLGTFDLGSGTAVLHDTAAGPIAALVALAYDGGRWDGSVGFISSAAAADRRHLTGIGVVPVTAALYTTYDGELVYPGDVLVRDTYYGDTNLDGVVTAADYTRIDAGFVQHLTGWVNGDFNHDGTVDGTDYALMDNAFNQQAGGTAGPAAAVAIVPEPTAAAAAALCLAGLTLSRRRRR